MNFSNMKERRGKQRELYLGFLEGSAPGLSFQKMEIYFFTVTYPSNSLTLELCNTDHYYHGNQKYDN